MKVAICLSGAMSKLGDRFLTPTALYANNPYVDFHICFNSTKKHIIEVNPNHTFDFYIHLWNPDLKDDLDLLYSPKKSLYEEHAPYNNEVLSKIIITEDFGGISKSLSMKKSVQLMEDSQEEYDLVMIYRPDVLLLKDMKMDNYDPQHIYVNSFIEGRGDFHFIMSYANAKLFKDLYGSLDKGNRHHTHFWIKNYIINFMNKSLIEDGVKAGLDQEVLRKVSMGINTTINPEVLLTYGSK